MTLGTALGQSQVNVTQAPAVEGDFASTNPRKSVLAGPYGLVAGANGVTIGRFAWVTYPPDLDSAPATVNNVGNGQVAGFVHREQQGLNTTYLSDAGMTIPAGFGLTLMSSGDFWVNNAGAALATPGLKAFANVSDGSVSFAAAGSTPGGSSAATTAIVETTLTLVGAIADNILTVTSVSAGTVYPGAVLSSNGAGQIIEQLTGTPGGAGTYLLSQSNQSVAAGTTIGGSYGLMTNGTVTGAAFTVGSMLTGTGVVAGSYVFYIVTNGGTGGVMVVSAVDDVASTTIVGSVSVETKWYARSQGAQNALVKISDQPLG